MKRYLKILIGALIIPAIGVFVIDYFSHLFFSNPMETIPYFWAKAAFYFVFSIIFLYRFNTGRKEFIKVVIAGIAISSIWGIYYNVLPAVFDFYPFGIALEGLNFLGMGIVGTGLAFGTVHTLAFVGGYYVQKLLLKKF